MSDLGAIETVGARLTLLDGASFRAQLEAATASLQAFNDEIDRGAQLSEGSASTVSDSAEEQADAVKTSAATATAAVKAQATETAAARDTIVSAQSDIALAAEGSAEKVGVASDAKSPARGTRLWPARPRS
jgi:multidrug resistance efflux pump